MIKKYLHLFIPLVFALCVGLSQYNGWFQSLNYLIYDSLLNSYSEAPADDVVIIAIDEQSLTDLGRWPWSRRVHGQLLTMLTEADVKAVVFDIIFAEENPADVPSDLMFVNAVKENGKVILPIHFEEIRHKGQLIEVTPFNSLYSVAQSAGHVHVQCDSDGICRSVYLREGIGSAYWPHLSLALLNFLDQKQDEKTQEMDDQHLSSMLILRAQNKLIPFAKNASPLQIISYSDVLEGRIPLGLLRNKVIFIGATSAGMNDFIATPHGPMTGIEFNTRLFNALRNNSLIEHSSPIWSSFVTTAFIAFFLYFLTSLSPSRFLLNSLLASVLILGTSHVLLSSFKIWHPPAAEILAILCFYPLWSWLRLELALQFLKRSLDHIQENTPLTHDLSPESIEIKRAAPKSSKKNDIQQSTYGRYQSDTISKTIRQIIKANNIAEKNRQLVIQTLSQLQEAVLVFDQQGSLVLKNPLADEFFPNLHSSFPATQENVLNSMQEFMEITSDKTWGSIISALTEAQGSTNFEARTRTEEKTTDLYVQAQHLHADEHSSKESTFDYLIFALTNVSSLKDAERARLDTLNFISHDLRSPMVSILALIENYRSTTTPSTPPAQHESSKGLTEFLENIEGYVKTNLNYAESLLQIGRAENTNEKEFEFCDLHSVLDGALMQVKVLSGAKQISLSVSRDDDDMWVWGNGELLERAFTNLLSNAVKYSPEKSNVKIALEVQRNRANLSISDQGKGIPHNDTALIFQRFRRGSENQGQHGAGLGLYFVQTVAVKHKARIEIVETGPLGTTFKFDIPLDRSLNNPLTTQED